MSTETVNPKGVYIPEKVLADAQLGSTQKLVYVVMVEGMDEDNVCRMSSQEIGDRLCITRAAANEARRQLCKLGYVRRVTKTAKGYKLPHARKKK